MPEESQDRPVGLFGSARRLIDLGLQTVQTRLELFSVEVREEAVRLSRLLIVVSVFVFMAAIALLALSIAVLFTVWEDPHARLLALWGLAAFYVLAASATGFAVLRLLKSARLPFSATLREIEKDRAWLQEKD